MSKDPAFLFYSSDFLTGVSDLTFEERGQYITLLCLHHQKGRLSKKVISIAIQSVSKDVMSKFKKDEKGFFYNERLEEEAKKRAEHSKKQRKRALDGWKKRKADVQATANATALPLENENENENRDVNKDEITIWPDFEDFWDLYDKKVGSKKKLRYKWNKLGQKTKEEIMAYLPIYKKAKPDKRYRKNPETFFNNESWKDEIIPDEKSNTAQSGASQEYRESTAKKLGII